jgi:sec-independent protein translocase protein TatC
MTATEKAADAHDPRSYAGEEMTLFEHLAELRSRLFKSVVAIVVGMLVGFAVNRPLLSLLTEPYCRLPSEIRGATTAVAGDGCRLIVTDVLGHFFLVIKVSAVAAIVIAGPVIAFQIWRFITPGLRPIERRYAIPFFATSVVLFAAGAVTAPGSPINSHELMSDALADSAAVVLFSRRPPRTKSDRVVVRR